MNDQDSYIDCSILMLYAMIFSSGNVKMVLSRDTST